MKEPIVLYSAGEDYYAYSESADLLADMHADDALEVGSLYYLAKFEQVESKDLVRTYQIIEHFDDELYDLTNSEEPAFADIGDEAVDELQNLIAAWIDKHVSLERYFAPIYRTSQKLVVTEEDMKDLSE